MTEIGIEAPVVVARPRSRFELFSNADPRTIEVLRHRHASSTPRRRGWLVRRMLVLADVVALAAAFLTIELLYGAGSGAGNTLHPAFEYLLLLATLPGWIVIARLYSLYDQDEERTHHPTTDDLVGVFHLVTVCTWLFFAAVSVTGIAHPQLTKVITFWVLAVALIALARACARAWCRSRITYIQNTIIVGAGDVGQSVARKLLRHSEYGINVVGFVDTAPKEMQEGLDHVAVLGEPNHLPELIRLFDVERVIVAFSNSSAEDTLEVVRSLNELNVQIDIVPRLVALDQARDRRHGRRNRAPAGCAGVRLHRATRQARLAGAHLLPPEAPRPGPARVRGSQVPHDEGRQRRLRSPRLHQGADGPAHGEDDERHLQARPRRRRDPLRALATRDEPGR